MKVVFLDIDGVLNSNRSFLERKEAVGHVRGDVLLCGKIRHWIPPYAVAALNRILETTGANVVISSTWRELYPLPDLTAFLEAHGILAGRIICKTPSYVKLPEGFSRTQYNGIPRGAEIATWLADHPEVTNFVILDDDSDMDLLLPWLVDTNCLEGLTESDADHALRILEGPAWTSTASGSYLRSLHGQTEGREG